MSIEGSPSARRGAARTAVVWKALKAVLGTGRADVLDIGGGTGGFAVRVAELGHQVVVVDPSPDALAALGRRAHERGLADRVQGHQGDASSLLDVVGPASADVVLCHGVLEYVDKPAAALAAIHEVLRPGGTLSVLASQRHAAVIARAMAGHFQQARSILDPQVPEPLDPRGTGHRFTHEELGELLRETGFEVVTTHGIRVFADLVPGSLLDLEPGAAAALVELEEAVAGRPEYLPLATQVHVVARR
jgi:S-adenosylmethionine-dependent methyltransferase